MIEWALNLNIGQIWMLLISIIIGILLLIPLLASITKDTPDSHFDRFTIMYLLLFMFLVIPTIFLLLYKYNPTFCLVTFCALVIFVLAAVRSAGPRYHRITNTIYGSGNSSILSKYWRQRQLRMRRREALRHAKSFVSPYKNIMGKLTLSNKYCKILFSKEQDICRYFCINREETDGKNLSFFVAKAMEKSIWYEEYFNSLCFNFSYTTKLENLLNVFSKDKFLIDDTNYIPATAKTKQKQKSAETKSTKNQNNNPTEPIKELLEKININEATEAELTALPGVNIVMAKKIIQHRDHNGSFKSIDEFIKSIKIKPHFEEQIRELIIVEPIQKTVIKKGERILDIDE